MKAGKSKLNSVWLLMEAEKRGVINIHQIALNAKVSRQTVYDYFNKSSLRYVDMSVIFAILDGIGFTPCERARVLLEDVFVPVEVEDE